MPDCFGGFIFVWCAMPEELTRYWLIEHDADCNETGAPQRRTYVKTNWIGFPAHLAHVREILKDWCRGKFGPEVVYVQGIAATLNWIVRETTLEAFSQAEPIYWGGYTTETQRCTIDIGRGGTLTSGVECIPTRKL